MSFHLQYKTKQGDWVTDRLRTYKTRKAAKGAVAFMVEKTGVRIVPVAKVAKPQP